MLKRLFSSSVSYVSWEEFIEILTYREAVIAISNIAEKLIGNANRK